MHAVRKKIEFMLVVEVKVDSFCNLNTENGDSSRFFIVKIFQNLDFGHFLKTSFSTAIFEDIFLENAHLLACSFIGSKHYNFLS